MTLHSTAADVRVTAHETLDRTSLERILHEARGVVRFEHCVFDAEDLSGLNLHGVTFMACSFAEAVLEKAHLSGTQWRRCRAPRADFGLADLSDAGFEACDLNNSTWTRARLASAVFTDVKLTGASFSDAKTLGMRIKSSLLVSADLRGLSFRKQVLEHLNLTGADLDGCDFTEAVFEGGTLSGANLKNARFQGADLRLVELGPLDIATAALHLKGSFMSPEQAAALVSGLGIQVVP